MKSKKRSKSSKNMIQEVIYGIHPIHEALKAKRRKFYEIYVATDHSSQRIINIINRAESLNIPVKQLKPSDLFSITGIETHQNIAAKVSEYPLVPFDKILSKNSNDPLFLILIDGIEDPHNLGALIRTSLCVGVNGIVILKDRAASPTPLVSKTSAGAMEHISITKVTNLVSTIKELKQKNIWIAGMDADGEFSLYNSDMKTDIGIVIGGEGKGIRPLVKKNCDFLISIPQKGPVTSLNASVAGAVVMYEVFRQRELHMIKKG